jgi:hypothetical protein
MQASPSTTPAASSSPRAWPTCSPVVGPTLDNPILYDEAGEEHAGIVWTGTDADDTLSMTHCTSYSTNTDQQTGRIGRSDQIDDGWTEWGILNCVNPARLYGLTAVLVPEPAGPLQRLVCLAVLLLLRASRLGRSARRS